ncbi:MAG: sigma-70 family RNA polymerase sigma factor [Candidatus Dormibacteraeota bacterium]|nr:sigma-70 family RNA polymerase sigma factor [Candidatus Dormibacteraeota bacterium]
MRTEGDEKSDIVQFPAGENDPVEIALEELEMVYAFIFSRVGNRPDAEDLTQQVALKAIPRLRAGASAASIRAYLFATARSALGGFWAAKFGMAQEELQEGLTSSPPAYSHSEDSADRATRILARLPDNYRRVLELRFLRGYSIKEVAAELKATPGSVKVMQLRALRAAAKVQIDV